MADYRRQHDDTARRHERDGSDRASDEVRSWFRDADPEERGAYGTYRTDDRDYHDRYRHDGRHVQDRGDRSVNTAASEHYRADQREDFLRWSAQNMGTWGEQHLPDNGESPARRSFSEGGWGPRERGGYWRQYEAVRPHYAGRGPKGYRRSDDRIREEICDCMTDDPALDASEIEVDVKHGEVFLTGTVTSRDQKRRAEDVAERVSGVRDVTNQLRVTREANGHNWAADSSRGAAQALPPSQPVTEASGKGTPSKTTSGTSA